MNSGHTHLLWTLQLLLLISVFTNQEGWQLCHPSYLEKYGKEEQLVLAICEARSYLLSSPDGNGCEMALCQFAVSGHAYRVRRGT